jgi:hypothetical protein
MGIKDEGIELLWQLLPSQLCSVVSTYAIFSEMQHPENIRDDGLVRKTFASYADPLMESLLLHLTPTVEHYTSLAVQPTYSYYRVYRNGSELPPHTDRPSCEYTISVTFGMNYELPMDWPLIIGNNAISMRSGDAVLYKGIDIPHSRPVLDGAPGLFHVQGFFHWVDPDGPHAEWKYDTRPSLGLPFNTRSKTYVANEDA